MDNKIIEIAAKAMKIPTEKAKENFKELTEINAFYFWNPARGGISVIVNSNGEKLAATSAVNFNSHLEEFKKGRRN